MNNIVTHITQIWVILQYHSIIIIWHQVLFHLIVKNKLMVIHPVSHKYTKYLIQMLYKNTMWWSRRVILLVRLAQPLPILLQFHSLPCLRLQWIKEVLDDVFLHRQLLRCQPIVDCVQITLQHGQCRDACQCRGHLQYKHLIISSYH